MTELKRAAVVVAHPDDETLWAGGLILAHPDWQWFVATLCRASDPDRAPRFFRVLQHLGATGAMADLDDGPDQVPLPETSVEETLLSLLQFGERRVESGSAGPVSTSTASPDARPCFDLVLTHGARGEYTRHRRHEEVCRGVVNLWQAGRIEVGELRAFAYEDGQRAYLPRASADADIVEPLPELAWREKYRLVTQVYGFAEDSWEARTTPRVEAFCCLDGAGAAARWVNDSQAVI